MTAFDIAFAKTMGHEGVYSNDPVDPGGETYMGISRAYWPGWVGWKYVDADENTKGLEAAVRTFYRQNFWNKINGDKLSEISQPIAFEVFDTAVNVGLSKAGKWLQEGLNLLNINQVLYPDIAVDGIIGNGTLQTVSKYFDSRYMNHDDKLTMLLKVMNHLQGCYYIKKMQQHPEKEKYRGWFSRT